MDTLRRHAAGELAEILGPSLIGHDRLQRTLQIRAAADRAVTRLPPAQLHLLERYAQGVNASIAQQSTHLPIEFRVLRYQPAPWTPRDSILVSLAMFQDLTNAFPAKLARESLTERLPPDLRAQLEQDLYPTSSWRDHPPASGIPDLTLEGAPIPDVPLDESQSRLRNPGAPGLAPETWDRTRTNLFASTNSCPSCTPGSNNWAVSGTHTASGKPLLSNDMHLSLTLPGVWYESDLEIPADSPSAAPFHVAGVTIPGLPFIVVGHNDHIAWGFTNLGADVQDVYIESTRGTGEAQEFLASDSTWQPVVHLPEPIKVKGGKTIAFEVLATRHGDTVTPILNPVLTLDQTQPNGQPRTISLRWTIYDPANLQIPTLEVDSAHDWPSFTAAFRNFGGPAQNVVYADDQGHIGFHAMGRIPLRGPTQSTKDISPYVAAPTSNPLSETGIQGPPAPSAPLLSGALSPVPLVPTAAHEWSGYIPFDQLPAVFDPPGGVIATANARTAPDDYPYPITLDWGAAYRTERIYHLLAHSKGLTPASMLAIQMDIDSDFDRVLAQRLTYALDHSLLNPAAKYSSAQLKTLHQAADLLRTFDGRMSTDSSAATIVEAAHAILWPMLLESKLTPGQNTSENLSSLYSWHRSNYALEQILMHTPARWLPSTYADWNDFLAAAVLRALTQAKAPSDLAAWQYGSRHTVDVEHPIFAQSKALRYLLGRPTGTGPHPQSGDGTTVKQVGPTFGPSQRFTADLSNLNNSTLNLVLGQSGNPDSPYFLDHFPAWLNGTTFPLSAPAAHTLTLLPKP